MIAIPASASTSVTTNLDDEVLTDRPISEVLIQGLGRVTEQEIRNNLRIATGQPFESQSVKDDVTTLYRLGQFDSVTADAELLPDGTVRVRYILIEQPIIKDIQVVGNKIASDQELRAVIGLYAGGPRDDFLLERAIEKIKNLYRAKGNYMVEVDADESRLIDTGILIFRIVEGPRVRIRDIVFSGNDRFTTNQLGAQIKTKPWVFIFSLGNLEQDMLIDDVATLDKFYKDRGFIDVRVDKRVEISASGKEARVVFVISEGRQYRLRSVSFESADGVSRATSVLQHEQVLGLLKIRPGDFYTLDLVEASTKAVTEAYQTMGYIDARVEPTWIRIGEEANVDMVVSIRETSPVIAGLVRIQGNYLTKDSVVRRRVRIQPGRPLDGRELELAKRRLEGSGLFTSATITPQPPDPSNPQVRDVLVEVKERNTGSISFGVGAGTDTGFAGNIALNQQNFDITDTPQTLDEFVSGRAFRGAGQNFSIAISPGLEVSNYSINFSDPNFLESDYGFGSSLLYRNRIYNTFSEERLASTFSVGRGFGDMWQGAVRTTLQNVTMTDFDGSTPIEVYEQRGPSFISSVGLTFARTNLDNPQRPSRGTRLEGEVAYFGALGGAYTYPLVAGSFTTWFPLSEDFFGRKSVLKLNTSSGYIFGSSAPVSERFYLGGRTLRGFEFRAISPLSALEIGADPPTPGSLTPTVNNNGLPNGQPIGGTFRFFAGAQYEVPIFDKFISGVLFSDSGTVTDSFDLSPYRVSIGCGVRLYIPQLGQAPLAFDFAVPVVKYETDQTQTFSFTAELPF
ncbi:MAG: outer membrane protein assembly factor BamA [Planctomycetota bacterium]|nr:outer membrane protein assembly factor BamA [Planctomycetota bacterium]